MLELIKSSLRFPWAMSMLGISQTANLTDANEGPRRAAATLDSLSRSAEGKMGERLGELYRAGDHLQNGMVETMAQLLPWRRWDPSGATRTAQDTVTESMRRIRRSFGASTR